MPDLDKNLVLTALKARLQSELEKAHKRAKEAAEGDKDMRATEASYVARGISGRVVEMEEALLRVNALELVQFAKGARIAVSALVELAHGGRHALYFLVPAGGGERLKVGAVEVQTLTTQSPLGKALLGLSEDEEAELPGRPGEPARVYEIVKVR
jgi:transcription elongation GreA/GreB family factor